MADAIVVGSGPNGLAAAITLARAGRSVRLVERAEIVGGGMRSAELTLPGFVHDVCSAIHPLALASPFLRSVPLEEHGVRWIAPPTQLAHPFDDGSSAVLERSLDATCDALGADGARYARLLRPLVDDAERLMPDLLGPVRLPRHPVGFARFGARGTLPATVLARLAFKTERARGFFAGLAAHSMLPLSSPVTAGYGLVLALLGHAVGWPLVEGGSQQLADALASYLRSLGGEIETGYEVTSLAELDARAIVLDTGPQQLAQLAGDRLPARYRRRLAGFRYGPGVFKLDWALDGPIPWRAPECGRAATVHLGPTLAEIAASERAPSRGEIVFTPYVLLAQQSLFDPSRVPEGKQAAWAYCHVPNGSRVDMTDAIERQVERFAPGFRERVLARSSLGAADLQRYNPNYVGGDINGGAGNLRQLFTRPVARVNPYTTPLDGVFIGSSSTPPGGGVHGMCGVFAARAALKHLERAR
ncbi:MAG TPA: NAD(P)/FAD-dependent oxidoreductase [Gaiellaceae bacterium]|nr:NAD(P)/FAD-dependent oxidoreductase [Gaiellaceae bacterium]